jgi:hypothetical protein
MSNDDKKDLTYNPDHNLVDWTALMLSDEPTILENSTGGIYEQVERQWIANTARVAMLTNEFETWLEQVNSDDEMAKLIERMQSSLTMYLGESMFSDIPYHHWNFPMVVIYAELRTLSHHNDILETILEQNKGGE